MNEFVIPFSGLKNGLHSYGFKIDEKFFEHFDYSEISECRIKVDVELDKQERMMVYHFKIDGEAMIPCDRCAGLYLQHLETGERLIVKIGSERKEESDEVITIPESDYQIDLSEFIFEYIVLAFPAKKVHPENENGETECDPEIIKRLGNQEPEKSQDPRWDALKKLKFDN